MSVKKVIIIFVLLEYAVIIPGEWKLDVICVFMLNVNFSLSAVQWEHIVQLRSTFLQYKALFQAPL